MIPNIFVSSTISDLTYLRDSIRDLISDLGYTPIMSEYGDIGYSPSNSAEESCYLTMNQCQLAVLIVGKRYGSISKNELSITHNEFKAAIENKIPVIFLVDKEMMTYKKIYESNESKISFPGVDNPEKSFAFITEFMTSDINNGIIPFSSTQSAKDNLKKQLAHLFGDLLRNRFDSSKGEIKDILSEISTLKHVLLKNEKEIAEKYTKVFRFLLDEKNSYLKDISESVSGSLEKAVQPLLESKSFDGYLKSQGVESKVIDFDHFQLFRTMENGHKIFKEGIKAICHGILPYETISTQATLGGSPDYNITSEYPENKHFVFAYGQKKFWGDKNAFKLLNAIYDSMKNESNA